MVSMSLQPVMAVLTVSIDRATAAGNPLVNGGTVFLPTGSSTVPVTFYYTGTRGSSDTSPITGFKCLWSTPTTLYPANTLYPTTCPSSNEVRTSQGWTKSGIRLVYHSIIEHKRYKIDNLFRELCNNYTEYYVIAIFVII